MKRKLETFALNGVFSLVIRITPSFLRQLKAPKGHQCPLIWVDSLPTQSSLTSCSALNSNIFKITFTGFCIQEKLGAFLPRKTVTTKFNVACERNITIITIYHSVSLFPSPPFPFPLSSAVLSTNHS